MFYIACDHVGIILKKAVKEALESHNIDYKDLGTHSTKRVDYPIYAKKLCEKVLETKANKGILICGTGLGMSMAANRRKGIRAAVCTNEYMAEMAVAHNNANVLCLGAKITNERRVKAIVEKFLSSRFEGGRHKRRIVQLDL